MYRSSLKDLDEQLAKARVGYDIQQLKNILCQIFAASELKEDGKRKFNELTKDVDDINIIHNVYHDLFTFVRSRCRGNMLLKDANLIDLRLYKFRAECLHDVLELFRSSKGKIRGYRIDNDVLPDVDVELVSTSSKSELLSFMERIPDSHVMMETLQSIHEYTGIL